MEKEVIGDYWEHDARYNYMHDLYVIIMMHVCSY